LGYALALTLLVLFGGSAGMHALEGGIRGGLRDYGDALWWTAMILTTMGSSYWPVTAEGRILCIFISLYAFGVFGYFTAFLATFFIGRDAEEEDGEVAGARKLEALRGEVRVLLEEVRRLRNPGGGQGGPQGIL
jgi:voltage-gated potassium channel